MVLEVNTLPGMTETSLLPKAAAASALCPSGWWSWLWNGGMPEHEIYVWNPSCQSSTIAGMIPDFLRSNAGARRASGRWWTGLLFLILAGRAGLRAGMGSSTGAGTMVFTALTAWRSVILKWFRDGFAVGGDPLAGEGRSEGML